MGLGFQRRHSLPADAGGPLTQFNPSFSRESPSVLISMEADQEDNRWIHRTFNLPIGI